MTVILERTFSHLAAILLVLAGDVAAVLTIPSVLLRREGRPLASLAWILALLALPFLGVLLWWLMGRTHMRRAIQRRQDAHVRLCELCPPLAWSAMQLQPRFRQIVPFALADRRLSDGAFPPSRATSVKLLRDGSVAFPAFESAIVRGQRCIQALFYIWRTDDVGRRIRDLLVEKARQGVRVEVLVDGIGGRAFAGKFSRPLREAGAQVAVFLPLRLWTWSPTLNFRNHRKLLLVDGEVAYTGGMNIGDEYAHRWHDFAIELRGPVVAHLQEVFQEDWWFATGRLADRTRSAATASREGGVADPSEALCAVIASGPDREANRVHDAFFLAITSARRRVWLTTPYFVPSPAIAAALRCAALRGVDVRIVVPERSDVPLVSLASRSYYGALLRAGAQIGEYTRTVLHAKALVVDEEITAVGSANADVRSFRLNFELACFVFSRALNAELAAAFLSDLESCRSVAAASLARRPTHRLLVEAAANLLSPLL